MPILLFIILVVLIAQVGFWDTFAAILGGVAMLVLFVLLAIALVVLAGILMVRRCCGNRAACERRRWAIATSRYSAARVFSAAAS